MSEHGDSSRTTAQQLGDDLRDAFAALSTADVTPEQRATFQRRLLAITTAAKRDVERSREQLARFWNDLRAADGATTSTKDE